MFTPTMTARVLKKRIRRLARFYLLPILSMIGLLLLLHDLAPNPDRQFIYLAHSFLDGHLFFTTEPGYWGDTALFEGRYYWPLGPLPALLLMPFVALLGLRMEQGYLLLLLNVLNLVLLFGIARKITGKIYTAFWLSFAYVFSTAYFDLALKSWSWYFAQVIAASLVLLAIHEFFHGKRWWLIGVWLALGVATRVNTCLFGIFFGLSIVWSGEKSAVKLRKITELTLPVVAAVLILLWYNYLRFNNILEFGYNYQLLDNEHAANREYGLWSLVHFPANFYYFFFKGPEGVFLPGTKVLTYPYIRPDIWGMSILFTSPILLWGLPAAWQNRITRLCLLTSLLMQLFLLGYYGIGAVQYGYRYAVDFYPFLFVLLAYSAKTKLTVLMRVVIVLSFFLNWYLIP